MSRILCLLALVCAFAVAAVWFVLGANTGWTKTFVAVEKTDPVTEIVYYDQEKRFVPGVDFLGAGLAGAAGLFILGLVVSRFSTQPTSNP